MSELVSSFPGHGHTRSLHCGYPEKGGSQYLEDAHKKRWRVLALDKVELRWAYQSMPHCEAELAIARPAHSHSYDDHPPQLLGGALEFWYYPTQDDDEEVFKGRIIAARCQVETDRYVFHVQAMELADIEGKINLRLGSEAVQADGLDMRGILTWHEKEYGLSWHEGDYAKTNDVLKNELCFAVRQNETIFDFLQRLLAVHGLSLLWDSANLVFLVGDSGKPVEYFPDDDPTFRIQEQYEGPSPLHLDAGLWKRPWKQTGFSAPTHLGDALAEKERRCLFLTRHLDLRPGDLFHDSAKITFFRVIEVRISYAAGACVAAVSCLIGDSELPPPYIPTLPDPLKVRHNLLAKVIKTDNDPLEKGRIQVQPLFDADQQPPSRHAWLPVLTAYEGRYEGFFFLPEPGDLVHLECLDHLTGLWAVNGTLRTSKTRKEFRKAETEKCLFTSKNTGLRFSCAPSPDKPKTEEIAIQAGTSRLELHQSGDLSIIRAFTGSSGKPAITIENMLGGATRIEICSDKNGDIAISSDGDLTMSGKNIRIKSNNEFIIETEGTLNSSYLKLTTKKATIKSDAITLKT